ncbi:NTP transferase domain-containing protein [Paracoccus luteus]|uniref:NTP transferase domain-containing protein n=1 Tax=Paracoccus luteus TaxID=2508543 RepID=UPI00106FB55E|nr:NTP transferase domain-containing protein [Paracoccus luteus]
MPGTRVGLLLAAGHGRRFGAGDKLAAADRGRPVLGWAADALRGVALDARIAVVRNPALVPMLDGFAIVAPDGEDQSASLRAGVAAARALGTGRLLIALGDMPGITADHLARVIDACTDDRPAATLHNGRPGVPACIPGALIAALAGAQGDRGAGPLLAAMNPVGLALPAGARRDIDRPGDLLP